MGVGALGLAVAVAAWIAGAGAMDGPWGMVPGGALRGADAPCRDAS